jgi:hypothetical protein
MVDLIVLAACKDMGETFKALLVRHEDFGIHRIKAEVVVHPRHDPAVLRTSHEFLRSYLQVASHALVAFDRDGCGRPDPRENLEKAVETRLAQNGWSGRSAAIVIDPELEVWFWSDSPHVESALGWVRGNARLEEWLVAEGYLLRGQQKPHRPKEAVLSAWRLSKTQRSSSNYSGLAEKVDFQQCRDPAFSKLKKVLKQWFPLEG